MARIVQQHCLSVEVRWRLIVVFLEDKLLQTGLYSEPGSTLKDATLLVHNSTFNVYDKNLLISAGRLNAMVKNNVFYG